MPDLVAHLATACIAGSTFRRKTSFRLLFYAGVLLPDLLTRGVYIALETVHAGAHRLVMPLHTPIGYALLCGILVQLFSGRRERRVAFAALFTGGLLHFALDAFQSHAADAYYWAFPFSWVNYREGLFAVEALVPWLPLTIGIVAAVEIGFGLLERRRGEPSPPAA